MVGVNEHNVSNRMGPREGVRIKYDITGTPVTELEYDST